MLELQAAAEGRLAPPAAPVSAPGTAAPRSPWPARLLRWLTHGLAGLLALGAVSGLVFVGHRYDWRMPKFADLLGQEEPPKDDWCADHSVARSLCVECDKKLKAKGPEHGWCRKHGVTECPLCHPESAQLAAPAMLTAEDLALADRALAFTPRPENNSKCKLHERRLQFASTAAADSLGIANALAVRGPLEESIEANGELAFDPTAVVRISARAPGVVWRVAKQVGDTVAAGELVALIEAPEVGKAKAELQHALAAADLAAKRLARLQGSAAVVPESQIIAADAEQAEAQVRVVTARQALVNLGLPVDLEPLRPLSAEALAQRLQFLGLPPDLETTLRAQTQSNSLLPVRAPLAGEVIDRAGVPGEAAEPGKPLLTIADPKRLWLTLQVRLEDAVKVKIGQKVRFRHSGHDRLDEGQVTWISPTVDEKSRTLPVRVEFAGVPTRHHARAFGAAEIVLRDETRSILVPSEAVHWEGDCNVVFVRDKEYESSPLKIYHVRKVRPGGKEMTPQGPMTEIIAGVLPGELVATTNSGILRSELLKNNLGAG